MAYRHVVLFRIHDHVEEHDVARAIDRLRTLADLPGIIDWRIARSLDERKGRIVVEEATFESAEAFAAFRAHPRHEAVAAEMAEISDWWGGDYTL
ncbi:Dabb family protein [Microbacterium aquilitoris]|uniref:Dabb family protein n=1 Tax=Microbacterium aquilitoris TaxID=3067307 RepID=UPI0028924735|nr:Dabb family protein [Microbacterium sp. KSW2-22]MDT3346252.1 Dabb family protein [Microbacterium sp. KSW2-22]